MSRVRISTTVDEDLLDDVRRLREGLRDALLMDEALAALREKHRSAEFDRAYAVYDAVPLDESDAWGDLASFRNAARRT